MKLGEEILWHQIYPCHKKRVVYSFPPDSDPFSWIVLACSSLSCGNSLVSQFTRFINCPIAYSSFITS
jgi:hypothetical protein